MFLKIGIDIGSTTVKVVVLDENNTLLFRSYERHYSKTRECTLNTLYSLKDMLDGKQVKLVITGSAGLGVAKSAELDFIQEVYATASAVSAYIPDADAVIELGGEDAKIIFFGNSLEERMNGTCAGGTGAFIDQMATLINVSVPELDKLSLSYEKIYPIASRCGVFAKTDIQPILNQGGRKEDIAASIFQAVVDQTVAGLTQGRKLDGKIVFLGGPLHFLQGLRNRFTETLNLSSDNAIFPKDGDCFAAIGAALCSNDYDITTFESIVKKLHESRDTNLSTDTMPPLFETEDDLLSFRKRHNSNSPKQVDINTYEGSAWLGIDSGSTTTKLVLITDDGSILYSHYSSNLGNPVSVVFNELTKIYKLCEDRIVIRGAGVTGYGEELIKNAFSCDLGLVETVAHYKAASHFNPDVDFIIDIGGQDMKCFKIRNGAVDSIMLNEACSSGCGSFIETFAKALGENISDFANLGLFAKKPVNLGSRCTVFMNSSVKQAQKDGATVEDISAGLSISIVKNAVYKVIRAANADDLGKNIVVQGGTFLNDAVLRAFEVELGRNVTRPEIAGIMGAFGAALASRDLNLEKSSLINKQALASFKHTSKPANCGLCTNKCSITVNTFGDGRRFISGNRCSRPLGKEPTKTPDLMKYKYEKLRDMHGKGAGTGERGTIGIPFGLNMYENLPFWFEFFTRLNFEVILSPESSRSLYIKGQNTIPSDTVCYPAKLLHGHIEALVETGVDAIWYPCMSYNNDEKIGDNHYNCPVVAYYPELIKANITSLNNTKFLNPYVGLWRRKDFKKKIAKLFEDVYGISQKETAKAADYAYKAYESYIEDIRKTGNEYIEYARKNSNEIIVLCGRPYHIDPEINHGINDLITSLDFVVITEDAISHLEGYAPRKVLNQWTFQSRMYNAARYVCKHENMNIVQLVSFGCGTDAITTDEMRDILEQNKKLYTQIKIDDISNLGATNIRIRSLMAAIEARKSH